MESRGRSVLDTPHARGMTTLDVIARSEATKQSSFSMLAEIMDCFASLAMTVSWLLSFGCFKFESLACIEYERATRPAFIAGQRACEGYRPHPEELAKQASRRMDASPCVCAHPSRRAQGALLRMRSKDMITTSKAGDPVIRSASDGTEKPQRTGYPAGACHRARRRARPGGWQ
jgi:hypothetical protein